MAVRGTIFKGAVKCTKGPALFDVHAAATIICIAVYQSAVSNLEASTSAHKDTPGILVRFAVCKSQAIHHDTRPFGHAKVPASRPLAVDHDRLPGHGRYKLHAVSQRNIAAVSPRGVVPWMEADY
jgi:hypothetical protein